MKLLSFFLCYSALGFLLEVVYTRLTGGTKKDRKCLLFLPLCPVYGVGAVGILLLPEWIQNRPALLFLAAGAVAVGAEYALAWFYERVWGVSFWDYSALPLQIQGRVCLPFALAWGLLSFPLVYLIQPVVEAGAEWLPEGVAFALGLIFLVDSALTGQVLRQRHSTDDLRWWVKAPPPAG